MKRFISDSVYLLVVFALGCSQNDPEIQKENNYTSREVTYALESGSGSDYNVSGTAVFKERVDLSTQIIITLNKSFEENVQFPVHLHLGDVTTDQADVAATLQPVTLDGSK